MATWKRLPQEKEGQNYFFAGQGYLTQGVDEDIPPAEIVQILADLHAFVQEKQGIDYLQVYEDENGNRLWIIDQVQRHELHEHPPEHNHFTILFPHEYWHGTATTCRTFESSAVPTYRCPKHRGELRNGMDCPEHRESLRPNPGWVRRRSTVIHFLTIKIFVKCQEVSLTEATGPALPPTVSNKPKRPSANFNSQSGNSTWKSRSSNSTLTLRKKTWRMRSERAIEGGESLFTSSQAYPGCFFSCFRGWKEYYEVNLSLHAIEHVPKIIRYWVRSRT